MHLRVFLLSPFFNQFDYDYAFLWFPSYFLYLGIIKLLVSVSTWFSSKPEIFGLYFFK